MIFREPGIVALSHRNLLRDLSDIMNYIHNKTVIILQIFFTVFLAYMESSCYENDSIASQQEAENILKFVEIPYIDFVGMAEFQSHETDENTIWYDDFSAEKIYMDSEGDIDPDVNFGAYGGSLDAGFNKGDVNGRGNRKVAFGDFPDDAGYPIVKADQKFNDIYWRIYVKHEHGWEGAPAKMSRATSIVSNKWQQAMIAHVWSGAGNSLTLDPASGVDGQTDKIKTTKYNDFDNLVWLGNKPSSDFKISSTEE